LMQESARHPLVKKSITLVTLILNYSKIKQNSQQTHIVLINSKWVTFLYS